VGLDMYFYGKRYLWGFDTSGDQDTISKIGQLFPEIGNAKIQQVEAEFMYWRKANQIHKWMVDNLQEGKDECQETYVEADSLIPLQAICAQVLADPARAPELLPAQSGFFFGGTDYDEWYFRDVQQTLDWLNTFLLRETQEALKGWEFYYRSSW
jgi:hypothetical protein